MEKGRSVLIELIISKPFNNNTGVPIKRIPTPAIDCIMLNVSISNIVNTSFIVIKFSKLINIGFFNILLFEICLFIFCYHSGLIYS